MENEVRNELTPKYRGIYDKAKTGRSPKSAIHAYCLICMSCIRKEIKECLNKGCPLYQYRPYQDNPWKARKRTTGLILAHKEALRNGRNITKSVRPISQVLNIKKPISGRVRFTMSIAPEPKKVVQNQEK